ncbi:cation transporter [Candidatus Poribacteria bacterium]|nr:cation transporter [Candidatus Poribacteria bacterium]MBT5535405.1 cation transporter [Candidatus Poribacteria bacterium]MBT5714921.1 cation transporter [Candidatus Poribacteria bacterium]MBT7098992.1 cation transporter [Candidatus Poribacteria bacterium]MBT7809437.1 cation transporter [Candidatus Poribacteria bacterium]
MSDSRAEPRASCAHEHRPLHQAHAHDDHDGHGHHHHHVDLHRPRQRRAFFVCIVLTLVMMVVEFAAGIITGSLMLISDAVHMLSHAAALGISFLALMLAQRTAGQAFSYGLYRVEILAALANGLTLAGFTVWIAYESVQRILDPVAVSAGEVTIVALIGLAVNVTTALILSRAGLEDLNTKSAFLHMIGDTLSSVAIVAGGVLIYFTGWRLVDPILSLVVAFVIGRWSWGLLRDSTLILMERKPAHVDLAEVAEKLLAEIPEIRAVHDLHVWEITSQFVCLSAHIIVDDMPVKATQAIRDSVNHVLEHDFGIGHAVIQVEC